MKFYDKCSSPFGTIYAVFDAKTLTGISLSRPKLKPGAMPKAFRIEMERYLAGRAVAFKQALAFEAGTTFEQEVWRAIREVPFGETRTYKWLAERLDNPGGSRAVGQALSKNPIPIVVPCHRIIESTGKLGGYSLGNDLKRRLLEHEYYSSVEAKSKT